MNAVYFDNFSLKPMGSASEGVVLQAATTAAPSSAGFAYDGGAGRFDLSIDYFDENDGKAWTTLRVDGVDIGTWTWDAELGAASAGVATRTSKTFTGLQLHAGSVVELIGQAQGGEPLRIEGLRFEPTPPDPVRIEAEAATLLENFQPRALDAASGGMVLQATKITELSRAVYAFGGEAGTFDLSIDYFDENDGKAWSKLRIDGVDIATWIWNAELGAAIASGATHATRTFTGLELRAGAVVELIGQGQGGEPLRIDALRFEPTPGPEAEPDAPALPGLGEPLPPAAAVIQAEAATLLDNFQIRSLDAASKGAVLQAVNAAAPSRAVFTFDGEEGDFNLSVKYFDENDGLASTTLRVDGVDIGTWTWNAELGSAVAGAATLTSKTFGDLHLQHGSVVELIGQSQGGEPLRIDSLHFDPAPPIPIHKGAPVKAAEAFQGAEGFGEDAVGGRGGAVLHVTNLNDSGMGSLRWALEQSGPRVVVFDVEGRIALTKQIVIDDPYVTIAGQTAPGQGIVVSGARISIESHDVIMRGMKMRVGDEGGDTPMMRDNIAIGGNGDNGVHDVVLDHNSLTWGVDENLGVWGTVRDITISNNIIAEALNNSIHIDEGQTTAAAHSMGFLIGHKDGDANSQNITVVSNLLASNMFRNAFIKGADGVEFVNNYVKNYGAAHSGLQLGGAGLKTSVAVVGNVYHDGQSTNGAKPPAFDLRGLTAGSKVYLEDNFVQFHRESATQKDSAAAHGVLSLLADTFFFTSSGVEVLKNGDVVAHVLGNAGARLHEGGLDVVDRRIVQGVIDGTAKIIDGTKEVGGYKVYTFTGATVKDTDRDGMPDWFEKTFKKYGFDAAAADDKLDYDKDGFTNVEEYVNGLIDGFDFAWGGAVPAL